MKKIKTPVLAILLTLLFAQAPTTSFGLEQEDTKKFAIAGAVLSGISGCAGTGLAIHTYRKLSRLREELNKNEITKEEREAYEKQYAKIKNRYWIAGALGALGLAGGIASGVTLYKNRNAGSNENQEPKPGNDDEEEEEGEEGDIGDDGNDYDGDDDGNYDGDDDDGGEEEGGEDARDNGDEAGERGNEDDGINDDNGKGMDLMTFIRKTKTSVNARFQIGKTWMKPLHLIIERTSSEKQISDLETLLNLGAYVDATDKSGKTPLHRALAFNVYPTNREIVKKLLVFGADVNARVNSTGDKPLWKKNHNGWPALLIHLDAAQYLPYDALPDDAKEKVRFLEILEELLKADNINLSLKIENPQSPHNNGKTAKDFAKNMRGNNRKFGRKILERIERREAELNKKIQEEFDTRTASINAIFEDRNKVRVQPEMDGDFEPIELPKSFLAFGL